MARSAWETELDAASGKRSRGGNVGRVLIAVLVVGGATFVAAYYVPLLRSHRALTALYGQMKDRGQTIERKLTDLEAARQTVERERDGLKEQENRRDSDAQARRQHADVLANALSEKLKKHIAKGHLTLSTTREGVSIGAPEAVLFAPGKDDPSPPGILLLCDVARAAGARPLQVRASLAAAPPGGNAVKPWLSRATGAAHIAQTFADKCAVPNDHLSVLLFGADAREPSRADAADAFEGVIFTVH
jgi:hypothetical protein